MNRFKQLFNEQQHAFIPFFTLGDPTPAKSLALIKAAVDAGCHALELGMPFSDPIADGPVIQASAKRALDAGVDFTVCLDLIAQIRQYTQIPIGMLMYYNLLFHRGVEVAYRELAAAGVDAILAVDVPLEESAQHQQLLQQHDLGAIYLLTPNTPESRAQQLLTYSTAFAYVVSDYGTTGVRDVIPQTTLQRLQTYRKLADTPLVVGFGINKPEQVQALFNAGANGAIIGSAIIKMIAADQHDITQAQTKIQELIGSCVEVVVTE